ncbi:Diphthamide biosynthesis protein 2 [Microbotryomycetes sp. JL201]|nr:Diphthamide biosynthesis protein 2 [Microbotryomycetes sp. JL201]
MASTAPPPVANSGEDAITRTTDVVPEQIADAGVPFNEAYEIDQTVAEIESGGYTRIALQFPDELLHDSVQVYREIRNRLALDKEVYVLADTTYGSCCVDEVAAQHVDADLVVHYGHTCLSPTARLPVIYVLTKRPLDTQHACQQLASASSGHLDGCKAVVLMYDVGYAYKIDEVFESVRTRIDKPVILSMIDKRVNSDLKGKGRETEEAEDLQQSEADPTESTPADGVSDLAPAPTPARLVPSESFAAASAQSRVRLDLPPGLRVDECAIFYIGGESLGLNNLLLTHGKTPVFAYDPATGQARLESSKANRMLMRRYAVVEKAKDADVIGILVGTLGVASYLPLIKHLRELIERHNKKSYTVAVGKLNPAKLANFMEVECFVLVACPENTMIDAKASEFLRPVVTPFELELALTNKSWTGDYILDFTELLTTSNFGQDHVDLDQDEQDAEGPVYSATTGKYRHPKRYQKTDIQSTDDLEAQTAALAIRDTSSAVARVLGSASGEFLANRSYKGLEPRYGMDAPAILEDMTQRGGIARTYGHERAQQPTHAEERTDQLD